MQKSIGQLLKERRTKLDWSLDQTEKLTSIKKIYISALETDNYLAMPGPFYARAYLKQYAQRLDLDVDAILEAYDKDLPVEVEGPLEDTGNYRFIRPDERRAVYGEALEEEDEDEEDETSKGPFRRYLPMILLSAAAIIILIAVGLIVFMSQKNSPHFSKQNYHLAQTSSSRSSSSSSVNSITSISKAGDITIVQVASKDNPINLAFTLKPQVQSTTINISDNKGKQSLSLSGQGEKGSVLLQKDANQVMITFSNADPVIIEVNGSPLTLTKEQSSSQTIKIEISYQK